MGGRFEEWFLYGREDLSGPRQDCERSLLEIADEDDQRPDFVPVSERLRLHYIEGAHAGLRGEWARTVREETAMLAETSRRYRRYRRDMREEQRVGQYLPPLTGYGRRGYHIDQEVF